MPSPTIITCSQLSRLVGTPSAPVIIDTCLDDDFQLDQRILPAAQRISHTDLAAIAASLINEHVVVYCQKGKKISQGSAAILRHHGVKAEALEGGFNGWRDQGLPLIPYKTLPPKLTKNANGQSATLWVTRHRPKIDRLACPWLIRRFVDPQAVFMFVAPSEVVAVSEKFQATPFDIEDTFWSHRGELCTFDTMVDEFKLDFPALHHLATLVRGADTNRHDLAPEVPGLLAALLGLSRMYRDDLEQLQHGLPVLDAFYRWARDATDETHDWPAASSHGNGNTGSAAT